MLLSGLYSFVLLGLASCASIPDRNGFPNPSAAQLQQIAKEAGGLLPNGRLPKILGPGSTIAFQLIAANEFFETAFFSSFRQNISDEVAGFNTTRKQYSMNILKRVLAQEQLHAIAAVAVLKSANKWAPTPCQYQFPTTDYRGAVVLAETFTAVVLGALQGANALFAKDGATDIVQIVSSVIGQEGEQNGVHRVFLEEIPAESPFLTYVPAAFAWSALQLFTIPGSCSYDLDMIRLPIFPPLLTNGGVIASVEPKDQVFEFTADLSSSPDAESYIGEECEELFLTYTTGQQLPVSVPITDVSWNDSVIHFKAKFPYSSLVAVGFSHAALTTRNKFASGDAVVSAALAGPAVIQVRSGLEVDPGTV